MQRQILSKYLLIFKRIYPNHPESSTWQVYERALSDINDIDLSAACEICLKELKFFPSPSEIISRVTAVDKFSGTSTFDISADFVPVKDWYESFNDASNIHVWADKYGRQKIKIVPKNPEHKLVGWPQHWNNEKTKPTTWEEARKKIGIVAKEKSL